MRNAEITVSIDFGDFKPPVAVRVRLEPEWMPSAAAVIDFPSSPDNAVFCTDPITARSILSERKRYAAMLTDAIMDALGKRDKIDGYPRGDVTVSSTASEQP